jgi:hypothetical protein
VQAVWEVEHGRSVTRAIAALGAEPVLGVPLVTTPGALAALARFAGSPPAWVAELVELGKGVEVTRKLLDGSEAERAHIYPIGTAAWESVGAVV